VYFSLSQQVRGISSISMAAANELSKLTSPKTGYFSNNSRATGITPGVDGKLLHLTADHGDFLTEHRRYFTR